MADQEFMTQLGKDGRISLPAKMRKALKINSGDAVVIRLEGKMLQIIPLHQSIRLAQERVKPYLSEDVSLVDDLIRARREEAARE